MYSCQPRYIPLHGRNLGGGGVEYLSKITLLLNYSPALDILGRNYRSVTEGARKCVRCTKVCYKDFVDGN